MFKISNRIDISGGMIALSLHPEDCALLARACEAAIDEASSSGGIEAETRISLCRAWSIALSAASIAALSPVVQPEQNDPVWQFCVLPGEEVSQDS